MQEASARHRGAEYLTHIFIKLPRYYLLQRQQKLRGIWSGEAALGEKVGFGAGADVSRGYQAHTDIRSTWDLVLLDAYGELSPSSLQQPADPVPLLSCLPPPPLLFPPFRRGTSSVVVLRLLQVPR